MEKMATIDSSFSTLTISSASASNKDWASNAPNSDSAILISDNVSVGENGNDSNDKANNKNMMVHHPPLNSN